MKIPVLLVSTATRWFGTARIPGALAKAGFDVSLLTPRNSLVEKSRFVARIGHLPDNATPMQWVFALATMVNASDLQPALQLQLWALIRESLGDSAHYPHQRRPDTAASSR